MCQPLLREPVAMPGHEVRVQDEVLAPPFALLLRGELKVRPQQDEQADLEAPLLLVQLVAQVPAHERLLQLGRRGGSFPAPTRAASCGTTRRATGACTWCAAPRSLATRSSARYTCSSPTRTLRRRTHAESARTGGGLEYSASTLHGCTHAGVSAHAESA